MSLTDLLKTYQDETELIVTPELEFIEKSKGGFSLKGFLSRQRSKLIKAQPVSRQGVSFSPSTVTWNYCRRIKVVQLAGKTDLYYEKAPPSRQTNFDLGNIIHDLVQRWFWDIGVLRGAFKCSVCKELFKDLLAPKRCPKCDASSKYMKYKEVFVENKRYKLRGRMDGILEIDDKYAPIVDIKSIAAKTPKSSGMQFCFEDLENGPKHEHVVQLNLYMFMSDRKEGHLLYFCKNDGRIKTFCIPYDKKLIEPYLKEIDHLIKLSEKYKKGKLKINELPAPCGRKDCPCESFGVKFSPDENLPKM